MNGLTSANLTKIATMVPDSAATAGHQAKDIYESVLQKHFHIIQTFLENINGLYQKHQEIENNLNGLTQKLDKLEINTQNIHHQFRTTHLVIDKRICNIVQDLTKVTEKLKIMPNQLPEDSFIEKQFKQNSHLKPRSHHRKRPQKKSSRQEEGMLNIIVRSGEGKDGSSGRTSNLIVRKSVFGASSRVSGVSHRQSGFMRGEGGLMPRNSQSKTCERLTNSRFEQRNERRSVVSGVVSVAGQSSGAASGQGQRANCSGDMASVASVQEQVSVYSGSDVSAADEVEQDQLQVEPSINIQLSNDLLSDHVKQFIKDINEKDKQDRVAEISAVCQQVLKDKVDSQHFEELEIKLSAEWQEMGRSLKAEIEGLKERVDCNQQTVLKNIGALEYKYNQKVQNQFFEDSMNNLSEAITQEFNYIQKYFSNKTETHRAIQFLQGKINRILTMLNQPNLNNIHTSRNKIQSTPPQENNYLKVIRVESHNGLELDCQKNKQQPEEPIFKSAESSPRLTRSSQVISAKKEDGGRRVRVSSGDKTRSRKTSIGRGTPVESTVGMRQWKDKVVRVLKKTDRRHMKVTFK